VGLAIVDDGDTGFAASSDFLRNINPVENAFEQDYRFAPGSPAGTAAATWTFGDLNDGVYVLSATWLDHANRTQQATYSIKDVNGQTLQISDQSGGQRDSVVVDQRLAPSGAPFGGQPWEQLGYVTVTGGVLEVTLQGDADGIVVADAMRLERVSVVTAAQSAPAQGSVRGEDNLARFVINDNVIGEITYGASDTSTFTSPEQLADLLNGRISEAGLADRVRAGYDAARNRMTFAALEVPSDGQPFVVLQVNFVGSDTLGFTDGQRAGPVLPDLDRLNLSENPLDNRAQKHVLPRLESTVAVVQANPNQAPQLTSPGPLTSASATGAVRFDGSPGCRSSTREMGRGPTGVPTRCG
jgi:hypothetical protein